MITRHRLRVAAILAIATWPALNYLATNWPEIARRGPRSMLWVTLITLTFAIAGLVAHRIASRHQTGGGGLVVVVFLAIIGLTFGYQITVGVADVLLEGFEPRIPGFAVWLTLVALTMMFIMSYRKSPQLHAIATTFGLIVGVLAIVNLGVKAAKYQSPHVARGLAITVVADKPARLPGLNVYYFILDAYGGRAGLKQVANFDNAEFYARMGQRGFVDASNERSNYLRTIHALGGIFSMQYPQTDDPVTWKSGSMLYPEVFDAEQPPALIRRLNAAGYTAWHSGTTWGGCTHRYVYCLGDEFMLETDYVTRTFLSPTPLGKPATFLEYAKEDSFGSVESRLPVLLRSGKPMFIFIHHMDPHPPFKRDAECKRRWIKDDYWNGWYPGREQEYVESVKCVNSQVEHIVDFIIAHDPNALIVLQSDHGSAFNVKWETPMKSWSQEARRERASFLNLVRAPADCQQWLKEPLGQINTARFVAACVDGRAPEYLPEHTYMTTYSEGAEKDALVSAWDSSLSP